MGSTQHTVQLHMRACKDPEGVLKNKKNTLVQCRTMLSKYINPADDEFEHDLNTLLSGLSETTKYPRQVESTALKVIDVHQCMVTRCDLKLQKTWIADSKLLQSMTHCSNRVHIYSIWKLVLVGYEDLAGA